ncbi:hypothetical protein DsansV1_C04g0040761 [Dioscorea sansibarensis]
MVLKLKLVMKSIEQQIAPLVVSPPAPVAPATSHRSVETLVVVLAVITIVAVLAGVLARVCGGRHLGESDVEGWVESVCRSCIDAGVPPPPAQTEASKVVVVEEKK